MENEKTYTPTRFMAETSTYNEKLADRAVAFIQCLKHTKGEWYNKPFLLLPWQERVVRDLFGVVKPDGSRQFNTAYVEISKKAGKMLALTTRIPTPSGWTQMGELRVGDCVFDETGKPCHVVAKSAVDDTEQAYRLTFRDGSQIVAGENHLWNVQVTNNANREKIWTTREIYDRTMTYRAARPGWRGRSSIIRIPVAKALQLPEAALPVDPYLYGYWLGNGTSNLPYITIRTGDVAGVLRRVPYAVAAIWKNVGDSIIVRIPALKPVLVPSFRDKVIRPEYLRASEAQRWSLLRGLMDSDGHISTEKSQSTYVSTIRQLAESVRELLWSLGIKNAMAEEPFTRCGVPTGETLYVIRFTTFEDQPTAGLGRKITRSRERRKPTRSCFHYLEEIVPLDEPVKMQCIQVDSASRCYLAGPSMVPTHNSELAAAVALLLTCGDGEQRAEVYGCAADRQQASIVFNVAADMVRLCPALAKRCKILDSQKRLIYQPTGSVYQVLSAEVATKHGFNVHGVVFDELHAQPNRHLYDVMTKGSGDARRQPLYFLISTAGNDTNSICYEVHQKARDILEGRKIDATFYPVLYGAEETDDWTDPAVWRKANPSLGVTVDIQKLAAACESAKQNPAEENLFRQLRLSQWVKQAVRWMPMEKWDNCAFAVDPEALRGRVCYGGLDLSSTTDITAFVLVFPPEDESDKYVILPFFWIPEDNLGLRVRRDHVPYDVWEKQGYLKTTEGNVVHYGYIESFIEELGLRYNIREIAFDRWGAAQMTQNLEGLGFTVVPVGQGFKDKSPPSKELLRLTLDGKIAHGGHPVLRWMMDNIYVRTDPAGNIKPDKEKSTEKIDGAVAAIMALDRAVRCGGAPAASIYDERGLILL